MSRRPQPRKPRRRKRPAVHFGMAWYTAEQYPKLLEISADADRLEATFEEWEKQAEKTLRLMAGEGLAFTRVPIDLEELARWCKARYVPIDGAARASYAAEKVAQR